MLFVDTADNIYYRTGTGGNASVPGEGWQNISGKLSTIAVGENIVVGTNSRRSVYVRVGKNKSLSPIPNLLTRVKDNTRFQ